ncbi:MAG: hypothetical protein JRI68_16355 [Deltaproteobacteria bacterium]|nr:hypothetical protein [Deltaproteobacteria bacterium]
MRTFLSSLALVAILVTPFPAAAQDSAAAERLFLEGRAQWKQGEHQAACDKFEASMAVEQSGGAALNLSLCHQHFGRPASAWAELRRAATYFRAAGEPGREQYALDKAAELEPSLSKLTIEASAIPGLEVTRNGRRVALETLGSAVPVDPGELRIEAAAPGHEPWGKTIVMGAEADAQTVVIPPLTEGAAPPEKDTPGATPDGGPDGLVVAGGVLVGVGAAVAIVGGVIGGTVLSDVSAAESDETLCGSDKECTAAGLEHLDAAESKAVAANVLIGVGTGVTVGGAVLLVVGLVADEPSQANAWTLRVGPGGAFAGWRTRF